MNSTHKTKRQQQQQQKKKSDCDCRRLDLPCGTTGYPGTRIADAFARLASARCIRRGSEVQMVWTAPIFIARLKWTERNKPIKRTKYTRIRYRCTRKEAGSSWYAYPGTGESATLGPEAVYLGTLVPHSVRQLVSNVDPCIPRVPGCAYGYDHIYLGIVMHVGR